MIKFSCYERDYILDSFWIASSSGGKTASDVLMVRLEGNRLLFLLTILVNTVFILVLRKMYRHGLTALLACPNQKHTKLTNGYICWWALNVWMICIMWTTRGGSQQREKAQVTIMSIRTTLLLEVSSCFRFPLKVFTPGATWNHKFHEVMVYRKEITAKGMR